MKKIKYFYNTSTLRYEKLELTLRKKILGVIGFLMASVFFGAVSVWVAYNFLDSPKEKRLKQEIEKMQLEYELMGDKLATMDKVLDGLQERDDNVYRVIFEADPIPENVREGFSGGVDKYEALSAYENGPLMTETERQLDRIRRKMYIQSKSYDDVMKMVKNKEDMLASIPAIQPVSNNDLQRIASGFNYRIDPIYKIRKFHSGIDFSAPRGTDVYSTGNGRVVEVTFSGTGYGYHVIISHGYGYKTLYGHLSKIIVKEGQHVKRGDLIGLVGSTGKSVAPHLHYEVMKGGVKVNPINYFYNDLTPEEFEKMLELASRHNQSLD